MSPEERQLITGLFDRMQGSVSTPRDAQAEALIAEAIKVQPFAPYFLAQAVIVQNQALEAAKQRIEELQAQLQSGQPEQPASGGFLSNLGSIFGGGPLAPPSLESSRPAQPLPGGPWGQAPQPAPASPSPLQGGPWAGTPAGGSFLSGALQSAAGVAGGVLLADSIRDLFGGHTSVGGLGMGTGFGGLGTGHGEETIINNYYDDDGKHAEGSHGAEQAAFLDDSNPNDFSGNDDGSFDV